MKNTFNTQSFYNNIQATDVQKMLPVWIEEANELIAEAGGKLVVDSESGLMRKSVSMVTLSGETVSKDVATGLVAGGGNIYGGISYYGDENFVRSAREIKVIDIMRKTDAIDLINDYNHKPEVFMGISILSADAAELIDALSVVLGEAGFVCKLHDERNYAYSGHPATGMMNPGVGYNPGYSSFDCLNGGQASIDIRMSREEYLHRYTMFYGNQAGIIGSQFLDMPLTAATNCYAEKTQAEIDEDNARHDAGDQFEATGVKPNNLNL